MVTTSIGIRELQQNASKYVREVEEGRAEYRVTVQGRDTGVSLAKASAAPDGPRYGVPLKDAIERGMWSRPISDDARQKMLAFIEEGRNAVGYINDGQALQ